MEMDDHPMDESMQHPGEAMDTEAEVPGTNQDMQDDDEPYVDPVVQAQTQAALEAPDAFFDDDAVENEPIPNPVDPTIHEVSLPGAEHYGGGGAGARAADPGYRAVVPANEQRGVTMPDGTVRLPLTHAWVEEEIARREKAAQKFLTAVFPTDVGTMEKPKNPERAAVADNMAKILLAETYVKDPETGEKRMPCMDPKKPEEFKRDAALLMERGRRMYVGDDDIVTIDRNDVAPFSWPVQGEEPTNDIQRCMISCMPDLRLPAAVRRLPMHHEFFMGKVEAMLDNATGFLSSIGLPDKVLQRPPYFNLITTNAAPKSTTLYGVYAELSAAVIDVRMGYASMTKEEYEDLCDGHPDRSGRRPGRAELSEVPIPRFMTPTRTELFPPPLLKGQKREAPPPTYGEPMNVNEFMKIMKKTLDERKSDEGYEEDMNWRIFYLLRVFLREWYNPSHKPFSKGAWHKEKFGGTRRPETWRWFRTLERFRPLAPTILRAPTGCTSWEDVALPGVFDSHFLECVAAWMSHAVQAVIINRAKDSWIDTVAAAHNILKTHASWRSRPLDDTMAQVSAGMILERTKEVIEAKLSKYPEDQAAKLRELWEPWTGTIESMARGSFAPGPTGLPVVPSAVLTLPELVPVFVKDVTDLVASYTATKTVFAYLQNKYEETVHMLMMAHEVALQMALCQRIICMPGATTPWDLLRSDYEVPPVHEISDDSFLRHRCYDTAMQAYMTEQMSFFGPDTAQRTLWPLDVDVVIAGLGLDPASSAEDVHRHVFNVREQGRTNPLLLARVAIIGNPLFNIASERGKAYWQLICGGMADTLQLLIEAAGKTAGDHQAADERKEKGKQRVEIEGPEGQKKEKK